MGSPKPRRFRGKNFYGHLYRKLRTSASAEKVYGRILYMGEVKTTFNLSNPRFPEKQLKVDALVDTGAVLPLISREIFEKLELPLVGKSTAELADNSVIELDQAAINIHFKDRLAPCLCFVGPYNAETLIGQVVLEQMDLIIDCKNKQLRFNPKHPTYPGYKLK